MLLDFLFCFIIFCFMQLWKYGDKKKKRTRWNYELNFTFHLGKSVDTKAKCPQKRPHVLWACARNCLAWVFGTIFYYSFIANWKCTFLAGSSKAINCWFCKCKPKILDYVSLSKWNNILLDFELPNRSIVNSIQTWMEM